MKTFITTAFVTILFLSGYSQTESEPTLKVTGKAKMMLMPDIVNFTFYFNAKDKSQNVAQSKLVTETNKLIDKLTDLGFSSKNIKYASFYVDEDWEYGNKPKKVGYSARNQLELAMRYDSKGISKFIDTISKSNIQYLDYFFRLEISDSLKNNTRDTLIKHAVQNAFNCAKTIANYSSVSLKGIAKIEYGDLLFNFASRGGMIPPPPAMELNYTPRIASSRFDYGEVSLRETEVYEEVEIVWNIKK